MHLSDGRIPLSSVSAATMDLPKAFIIQLFNNVGGAFAVTSDGQLHSNTPDRTGSSAVFVHVLSRSQFGFYFQSGVDNQIARK